MKLIFCPLRLPGAAAAPPDGPMHGATECTFFLGPAVVSSSGLGTGARMDHGAIRSAQRTARSIHRAQNGPQERQGVPKEVPKAFTKVTMDPKEGPRSIKRRLQMTQRDPGNNHMNLTSTQKSPPTVQKAPIPDQECRKSTQNVHRLAQWTPGSDQRSSKSVHRRRNGP